MKALIDNMASYTKYNEDYLTEADTLKTPHTDEVVGVRISQIAEEPFDVTEPFYWVDCPEGVTPETHCYNETTLQFVEIPKPSDLYNERIALRLQEKGKLPHIPT